LEGGPLDASDKYSFDLPPITSEAAWQALVSKALAEAEQLAEAIERLEETQLSQDFADPKYGSYHRNLLGVTEQVTEHTHYHLGQISLLKKLV
jgi:hypothetical protein